MRIKILPVCKLLSFIASILAIVGCSSLSRVDYEKFEQPVKDILITNINALSESGESMLPNQNILIRNGQIILMTPNNIEVESALVIDGLGKYVIPGLIDSHVHIRTENDLLVYLAHGITYVREMSGNDEHLEWKADIKAGRAGPSIDVSSEKISSKSGLSGFVNEIFWNRINISSEQEAVELIDELKNKGYANAKISSDINREMYFEIIRAAKQNNFPVTGHIPSSVSFSEFIKSEHKEIAHIEELVKTINKEFGYFTSENGNEFLDFVKIRSREMAKNLKENNVSVGTTFWYMQSIPKQVNDLSALIKELDFSFTNPKRVSEWMPEKNDFARSHTHLKDWWLIFAKANQVVLDELIESGVIILAGTDAMTTLVAPGISLHQELEALVNAGMPNKLALKSATIAPAQWMGEKVGTLAKGYKADLVILNGNPLKDMKATTNISSVIKGGRLYNKELLESMIDDVRSAYSN